MAGVPLSEEWLPPLILFFVGLVLVWCVCTKGLQSVDALYDQQHLAYTYRLRGSLWSLRTRSTVFPDLPPGGVARQAWYEANPPVTPPSGSMEATAPACTPPGVFQPLTHISWFSQGDVRVWAGLHSPQTTALLREGLEAQRLHSAPPVLHTNTPRGGSPSIPVPVAVRIETSHGAGADVNALPVALRPSQAHNVSGESASSVTPLLP